MRKMYEIMSAKLADPTYGDKMEKEVHVKVNKDGAYYIPNDDLMAVDDALFPQISFRFRLIKYELKTM